MLFSEHNYFSITIHALIREGWIFGSQAVQNGHKAARKEPWAFSNGTKLALLLLKVPYQGKGKEKMCWRCCNS